MSHGIRSRSAERRLVIASQIPMFPEMNQTFLFVPSQKVHSQNSITYAAAGYTHGNRASTHGVLSQQFSVSTPYENFEISHINSSMSHDEAF